EYLDDLRGYVLAMRSSLEEADFKTVGSIGHRMKGSGGGYGFEEVSRLGMVIEDAAAERDSEGIREAVEAFAAYLDRVQIVYD
ncbi:MAG: Hpt domain-containing protein, partial [Acidobacteriota bacterium]